MPVNIFHLVCPNGLGHFKRTTEIWGHLKDEIDARVIIACEKWQFERTASTATTRALARSEKVNFEFTDMEGALRWSNDPGKYSFDDYQNNIQEISQMPSFKNADIVLSDNLAGIVGRHPEVMLVGSFMWHDVLSQSFGERAPHKIVKHEKKLLDRYKPKCISVGEATMQAVKYTTDNYAVNWFCDEVYERPERSGDDKWRVLFSTGLSGAENRRLEKLFRDLSSDPRFEIWATPVFKKQFGLSGNESISDFDFTASSFRKMDIIVARPGVGSLTEAIKYRIPVVAVDDGKNTEMVFNASRVSELGIGWNALAESIDVEEIIASYPQCVKNLKNRPVNGFEQFGKIINTLV